MEKKAISFLDAFPLTCYLEYFKNILADFILEKFDHDNSSRYFLYEKQGNKKIFLLHKKLKVIYSKRNYEVPILMYFPENFPNTPPEIYLEKRSNNLEINPNIPDSFINRNTLKIQFNLNFCWEKKIEQTLILLEFLEKIFSKNFPVFSSKKQLLAKGLCQLNIKNIIPVLKLDGNNNFNNDFSTPGNNLNETFETPRPEIEKKNQNDFFIDEDLKHPLVNCLKEKLFDLIQKKKKEQREINLELNQLKNELLRKLNLIAQVHKNEKSLKEIERKSKEDYQKIYKDMKIGDYSIVDKCESILTIFNPKTLKRHVNEIMLQDLLREIKRGLEKKNISFQDALINYRTISREIFYIQRIQEMHPDE